MLKNNFFGCSWGLNSRSPKLNINLPYDSAIPLLGIYLKECNSGYYKGTCTPMFIAALVTIAKLWKQPRSLTVNECIKKM
jgi:hypothetical protein